MPTENYEFEVDLRFGELLSFQAFMLLFRMRAWFLVVVFGVAAVYMGVQLSTGEALLGESIPALAIVVGLPCALVGLIVVGVKQNYESVWKPQLPISYAVGDHGVETSATNSASQIAWEGIDESRIWGGLILLFMNRHCAIIIPRRCVGSRVDEFASYVEQRVGTAA